MLGELLAVAQVPFGQVSVPGSDTLERRQEAIEQGGTLLVSFLLDKLGVLGGGAEEAALGTMEGIADTTALAQDTLQAQLRGETTPMMRAISRQLHRAFRGQRQAAVASGMRLRPGGGSDDIAFAQQRQQDEIFAQTLADLLARFQTQALGTAVGQLPSLVTTQQNLLGAEQKAQEAAAKGLSAFGLSVSNLFNKGKNNQLSSEDQALSDAFFRKYKGHLGQGTQNEFIGRGFGLQSMFE